MAANTDPRYTLRGDQSTDNANAMPAAITGASGDYDGTGANNALVHTAGASGSYVRSVRFKAKGTNVASVARVYLNNGSTNGTGTNNLFIGEVALPATTATNAGSTAEVEYPINRALKAGWRVYVGIGTAVAAGWVPNCDAGQYE